MIALRHTAEAPVYIAFPPALTTYAFDMADGLSGYIRDISGVSPARTCEGRLPEGACAVLLGETPLKESADALQAMGYGRCVISLAGDGHRLVAATHTESLLTDAVRYLTENMTWADGALLLPEEARGQTFFSPGLLKYLPLMDAGRQVHCRSSLDRCDQIVVAETTEADYRAYIAKLRQSGFEVRFERTAAGNRFARLTSGPCSAYVYYTPFNGVTRMLAEPVSNAHREEMPPAHASVKPLMTVIGGRFSAEARYLNCDSGSGNMGYVFRLADGRFLLVDGGMESGDYADNIMKTLKSQAPDPQHIVIACWFLSHTHIDHTGAFLKIAEAYSDQLEVSEIACNFPSVQDAECFREAWNTRRVREAAYRRFPKTKYTKLHSGELLTFGDARVEILYTQDDLVRQYLSLANETLNTASICMRVTIGGNTVMLPADCDTTANGILLSMYGAYLKSDMLQVCHHGGWGGVTETYAAIDPELAIFSTSDELFPKYLQIQYNHDLVYDMHVMETYNNADRLRTFELPYHPPERRLPPDPKGALLYTEAKQLEALASIEKLREKATDEKATDRKETGAR